MRQSQRFLNAIARSQRPYTEMEIRRGDAIRTMDNTMPQKMFAFRVQHSRVSGLMACIVSDMATAYRARWVGENLLVRW